ncbi:hypothetical protein MOE27_00755 [Bacillus atrophaeus]|uniref:hypothetical protein n=1 Tax=Bacillus atrophaeus TaxID=1452 RepID=UPI0022811A95|nr:hypothetical protein [Bacillus atrophaeus]MCY8915193.1 hypothetical protein [Bacillus atrophaeus]
MIRGNSVFAKVIIPFCPILSATTTLTQEKDHEGSSDRQEESFVLLLEREEYFAVDGRLNLVFIDPGQVCAPVLTRKRSAANSTGSLPKSAMLKRKQNAKT